MSVVRFRPWAPYTNSLAFSGAFLCLEFRGWMRITDVVRPIAKQSATSAPARSPQGTNRPKPVWILPPRAAISYPNNCTSFSGAFLCLEFRGWMRITDVVRPIAKQSATSAPARSPQGANRPKPVWILPPRAAISYPNNCTSFSGAFLSLEFRGWMRTTDVVRPIAKQSASSAPVRSPQGTPLSY